MLINKYLYIDRTYSFRETASSFAKFSFVISVWLTLAVETFPMLVFAALLTEVAMLELVVLGVELPANFASSLFSF